ncbi:S8 family serine peptidase [Lysobacter capsici]|uniref:S8 family serine peptidase n=1 Tax=Lysobacter capsici TaxID=435897 RepID=UPI00287BBAB2|nr:S8 family serine peptidase [Lysobacter capsici]WND83148.1 S8 family serine peptidase [Lysobacter capsici]WND88347.1 S8 family serine peptidase [Lysobacter capsici]
MKQSKLVCALGLGLAAMVSSATSMAQEQPNPNRVWVKFKQNNNTAAGALGKSASAIPLSLQQRVSALRNKLAASKAGDATVNFQFDKLNAAVLTLPSADAIKALRANPDVESVEIDYPRYPMAQSVPYGIDQVQARDAWDVNRDGTIDAGAATGAGIKVCVIDSGINSTHEDFAGVALTGYPTGWNTDTCSHGTHVAGTIAAANNATGVVGVSPGKVSLHIIKIFGSNGYNGSSHGQCSWTYSSTLVDAAQRCASAGAKVINMSLGGANSSTTERNAFQTLANNGVLSIAAAGNSGNATLSYPASYPSVVSVAAVDQNNVKASFSQFNAEVELSGPGVDTLSTTPLANDPLVIGNSQFAANPIAGSRQTTASAGWVNGGLCTASSSTWRNKVVLCQRGTNTFNDKVTRVKTGGGLAMVVYNNVDGPLSAAFFNTATPPQPVTSTLPAVGISKADGETIIASLAGQTATVDATPSVSNVAYENKSGTSMATPHVAGAAAVVWSSKPTATAQQVLEALETTALDIDAAGRDNNTGWGLVQIPAAIAELQSQ